MAKERFNFAFLLLLLAISLGLFEICCEAASKQQQRPSSSSSSSSSSGSFLHSSVIFPVRGNVYPSGLFYTTVHIGNPPRAYVLEVDTGSDLAWLQCDAGINKIKLGHRDLYKPKNLVPRDHALCTSLGALRIRQRDSPQQCDYEVTYADGSSSLGVLVKDAFTLDLVNGSHLHPHLAFGCGYDQQGFKESLPVSPDGMLGLGYGESSIISQLRDLGLTRNVIGHCFSGQGTGYLFFGAVPILSPFPSVTWTPMSRNPPVKHYSPGHAKLLLDKQQIGLKDPVVFDSGSSYTYFESRAYTAFVHAVTKDLSKQLKEAPEDETLPLCWKGSRQFNSVQDVRKFFKPLALIFPNGKKAQLKIPPEGYLIISSQGNVCLGILNGTEMELKNNMIGDISMQDLLVIYDNERHQIGWVRADCNRLPNVDGGGDGFNDGFTQSYVASMEILRDDL